MEIIPINEEIFDESGIKSGEIRTVSFAVYDNGKYLSEFPTT